jgi:hypothetical protein
MQIDPILAQIGAALLGACVALSVVFMTHRMTLARSLRDRTVGKLEDLMGETLKFSQQSQRLYDLAMDVEDSSNPDEFDSRIRDLREARLETYSRIQLLSSIYYSELTTQLEQLWPNVVTMDKYALLAGANGFSKQKLREAFDACRKDAAQLRFACLREVHRLTGSKASPQQGKSEA